MITDRFERFCADNQEICLFVFLVFVWEAVE